MTFQTIKRLQLSDGTELPYQEALAASQKRHTNLPWIGRTFRSLCALRKRSIKRAIMFTPFVCGHGANMGFHAQRNVCAQRRR